MGLGLSGFCLPCAFFVPTFAIATVETTVKKTPAQLLEIAVPFQELKMSVHFPMALAASLYTTHCASKKSRAHESFWRDRRSYKPANLFHKVSYNHSSPGKI